MIKTNEKDVLAIIDLALKCKACYKIALQSYKSKKYKAMEKDIEKGDGYLLKANQIHASLLSEDRNLDLLLVHVEDTLMSTQIYVLFVKQIIDLYKEL